MKRIVIILLLAALGPAIMAQSGTESLKQLLEGNRVSFSYALTATDKVQVKTNGTALIDGECYRISGNGLDIYCDGSTKWTIDNQAKEVYLEPSEGTREFLADPSALLEHVHNLTVGEKVVSGVFRDPAGMEVTFRFTSIKSSAQSGSTSGFTFDTSSLSSDWVVTDLR